MHASAPLSAEALAHEPGADGPWELVKGEFVPLSPTGPKHGKLAGRLYALLLPFIDEKAGWDVVADNVGFLVERDPDTLLSPDVAAYRVRPSAPSAWVPHAPDVAVEILSPGQTLRELDAKRFLYLNAGAEQVWIVDPRERTITIYHRDGHRVAYHDEELEGTGCLEGFAMHVGEYFARAVGHDEAP